MLTLLNDLIDRTPDTLAEDVAGALILVVLMAGWLALPGLF